MVNVVDTAGGHEAKAQSAFARFRAQVRNDGISLATARFRDKSLENDYIGHLIRANLPGERALWCVVMVTYFFFGVLDILTVNAHLGHILSVRFVTGAAIVALIPLSYVERIKPHFGWLSASAILITSVTIIYMIGIMPAEGAPPYIIGVLVVFIASSCTMRIGFRVASFAYATSSIAYLLLLNLNPKFSATTVIAGHFFIISIASVAILTIYLQEIRARRIWRRDQQRNADSAFIEKLLIEATAADQSKINFLSMMSHELRTPLHQIIGFAELARHPTQYSQQPDNPEDAVDQILDSAHILLSRIQKMLRYADATAGKIQYDKSPTSVHELVQASLEQGRGQVEKKGIRVDVSALEEARVNVDIFHTCYALNNILENALNASDINGRIWFEGALQPDNSYSLTLRDEGSGMTAEQISNAFRVFTQGENILTRSQEGLGVGLTLANRIFSDQGADMEIRSEPSKGTTVTICFTNNVNKAAA